MIAWGSSKHPNNDFPLLVVDWTLTSSTSFHLLLEWGMIPVRFEPASESLLITLWRMRLEIT